MKADLLATMLVVLRSKSVISIMFVPLLDSDYSAIKQQVSPSVYKLTIYSPRVFVYILKSTCRN